GVGASLPGSLNLSSAAASHAALVGVASLEVPELLRVAPGDPDNSYLVHKLEGSQAVGSRMPLGGPFLSEAEIGEVRQWIESGALND
ncbi:MAG: PE-PGRS family protein, partial [Pseudomonadota bacterium]